MAASEDFEMESDENSRAGDEKKVQIYLQIGRAHV
jgi:hypothetical protein